MGTGNKVSAKQKHKVATKKEKQAGAANTSPLEMMTHASNFGEIGNVLEMAKWTGATKDLPPELVMHLVQFFRFGAYKDEFDEIVTDLYRRDRQKYGEAEAPRRAYRNAAKHVFFVVYLGSQAAFFAAWERIRRVVKVARS
jgi:hypothetical protein